MKFRFDDETKARKHHKKGKIKSSLTHKKRNAWKLPQNAPQLQEFDEMREKSVSLANLVITMSCHNELNAVNEKELMSENHAIEKSLNFH